MTLEVARGVIIAGVLLGGLRFAIAGLLTRDTLDSAGPFWAVGGLSALGVAAVFLLA